MIKFKITQNDLADEQVIARIKSEIRQDMSEKFETVGNKLARWIETQSKGEIEPQVEKIDTADEIGVVVRTFKPKEIQAAKENRIFDRAWRVLPGLIRNI